MSTPSKPSLEKPPPLPPKKSPPQATPPPLPAPAKQPKTPDPTPNPLAKLPPPELGKRGPGRPPGKAKPAIPAAPDQASPASNRRALPDDPGALAEALKPCKVMARPLTQSVNALCSVAPPEMPLTDAESDALTESVASCLYVYGGEMSPLVGLALVLFAVTMPRVTIAIVNAKKRKAEAPAPVTVTEKAA